jgi:hypothetical protein
MALAKDLTVVSNDFNTPPFIQDHHSLLAKPFGKEWGCKRSVDP